MLNKVLLNYIRLYKKLTQIFTLKERQLMPSLMLLIFMSMLLEISAMSLVAPTIALMTQTDLVHKYPQTAPFFELIDNPSQIQLIIGGMFLLVVVFMIKALFLGFVAWKQNKFIFNLQANLSSRLYAGYLLQPWPFHLQRNSAQLILNATTEINILVETVLQPGMMFFSEVLILLGMACVLFAVEPLGAMVVVCVLGVASLGFQRVIRKYLVRWGEARQRHDGARLQHLQQGLGGVKEVKLLGREREFLMLYNQHNNGFAHIKQRQRTLLELPRLWLELLAVSGLALLVFLMLVQKKPLDDLLLIVGLFAAAAFRLMPSLVRVLGAVQNIRAGIPVIETLHAEINLLNIPQGSPERQKLFFNHKIVLEQIYFQYSQTQKKALCNVNLHISRGEAIGIIGQSGSGKSTLIDIILGLLPPQSGCVIVDGINIQQHLRSWQNQIGYVPQSIYLTDDSLRRNVAFGLSNELIDEAAVIKALKAAQLYDFVSDLPQGLDTFVGERGIRLSGGQRQRIGIARALYADPEILILDEATSALDMETEKEVMEAVNALHGNKTLIIVAHRLSTVAQCDRLYKLHQGQIVDCGSFEEVTHSSTSPILIV